MPGRYSYLFLWIILMLLAGWATYYAVMNQPDIFYLCGYPANGILIITECEAFLYLSSVSYEEVKRKVNSSINCVEFRMKVPWDDISLNVK